jgi:predicted RNA-binding Zn-ribbon protein involved in translation (DUF1610 family)
VSDEPAIWSHDALLQKARVYAGRAAAADAESSLFPLWSLLALEFLARSAVARVHPALLADPQKGENLLYGFGYGNPEPPRSVPFKTVLLRCRVVIPRFTEDEVKQGSFLMELRNQELHSGDPALEELATSTWLPTYYGLVEILLESQDLGLDALFPADQVKTAKEIIKAAAEDVESEVKQRIADARKAFEGLEDEAKEERRGRAVAAAIISMDTKLAADCPACGSRGLIDGEVAGWGDPRVGEVEIERDASVLPTAFACPVCGLQLKGHAEMLHAGLGDQYTVTESEHPVDFYGIDVSELVSPEDFFEPDYGND